MRWMQSCPPLFTYSSCLPDRLTAAAVSRHSGRLGNGVLAVLQFDGIATYLGLLRGPAVSVQLRSPNALSLSEKQPMSAVA